jgi:basic membrane protein A
VSAIGGQPTPPVQRYLAGFRAGVEDALPRAAVLIGYSRDFVRQNVCEQLANRQIDRGSDIVFAVAGICSFGALKAAELRHVWGVGVDGDLSYLGPHILASAIKREDRAALLAVKWFTQDRLPGGRDVVLDLKANGVGVVGIAGTVPQAIRSKLATVDGKIRAGLITVPSSL